MEKFKLKTPINIVLKRLILPFAIIVGIIAIDVIVKQVVMNNMTIGQSIEVIKNFFYITFVTNSGAAFGSFAGASTLILVITGIAIPLIIASIVWFHGAHRMLLSALALIAAGGLGNIIDRIFYGGAVTDMFEIKYFGGSIFGQTSFPIFNIADIALTVGTVLILVYFFFMYYDKKNPEEVAKHERKARVKAEKRAKKRAEKDVGNVLSVEEYLSAVEEHDKTENLNVDLNGDALSEADSKEPPTTDGKEDRS